MGFICWFEYVSVKSDRPLDAGIASSPCNGFAILDVDDETVRTIQICCAKGRQPLPRHLLTNAHTNRWKIQNSLFDNEPGADTLRVRFLDSVSKTQLR